MTDTSAEESLRKRLAERQVLVVAGAGVTVAATGAAVASWRGLLGDGIARVGRDCESDPDWVEVAEGLYRRGGAADYIQLATMITERLGPHRYALWLRQTVGELVEGEYVRDAPAALIALGAPIATTNFDTVLEAVGGLRSTTWRQRGDMQHIFNGGRGSIAHLHGVWNDPETVVFGNRTYEDVLRDAAAQQLQKAVVLTRSLLFVGVGQGGNDPNIGGLLGWLAAEASWSVNEHFWLCANEGEEAVAQAHGATAVRYGSSYEDLPEFLRGLAPAADRPVPPVRMHRTPPTGVEPWLTTQAHGPWTAMTVDDGLWVLDGGSNVLCHSADGSVRRPISELSEPPLRDLALTDDGSYLVAVDGGGFRVWTINLDGSLTSWTRSFSFPTAEVTLQHVQRGAGASFIDLVVSVDRELTSIRLEKNGRIMPCPVGATGERVAHPLRNCATGQTVTLRASLDGTTLRLRREDGAGHSERSVDTGCANANASRVVVARPLRSGAAPFAVVVETGAHLAVWRWQDIGGHDAEAFDTLAATR